MLRINDVLEGKITNSRRKESEIENVQEKYTKRQMNKQKIKYRLQQITGQKR